MAIGAVCGTEKRQERHQELVSSHANIQAAIRRLEEMASKVKHGNAPPTSCDKAEDVDLSSLGMVLSSLSETMTHSADIIDKIRGELEEMLF